MQIGFALMDECTRTYDTKSPMSAATKSAIQESSSDILFALFTYYASIDRNIEFARTAADEMITHILTRIENSSVSSISSPSTSLLERIVGDRKTCAHMSHCMPKIMV